VRAVDWFNEHLKERRNPLLLDDRNIDLYSLYMAKKTGKPNDDFPSKFLSNEYVVDSEKHKAKHCFILLIAYAW